MSFWKGRKTLVTGAHGFTGSHLCRELRGEGADVRAFVKNGSSLSNLSDIKDQIEILYGDITDIASLQKAMKNIECVFHPAAIVPVMDVRQSPQRGFLVNGIGAFNVAQAAMEAGVKRMLHISTCHVYGNQPESELPIHETTLPLPQDLYAASKYAAEIYLRPLIDEGAPIIISRAFAKYGPGQGSQYIIPRIITEILQGRVPRLGSPMPTRDYSHIVDIARGYMLILEKGNTGEIYHLSSEKETSIKEVSALIVKILGKKIEPVWGSQTRPQDIMRLFGNSQKARKELGWKPTTSLENGLKQTIEWFKNKNLALK